MLHISAAIMQALLGQRQMVLDDPARNDEQKAELLRQIDAQIEQVKQNGKIQTRNGKQQPVVTR